MTFSERCGFLLGYLAGIVTFIISYIRGARTFHPCGLLYEATVKSDFFPSHAMVRLSSAWWKNAEWKDVLGIAIRFMPATPHGVDPSPTDQDLLFASFPHAWMILLGPFMTDHHDFLGNHYFAIAPFYHEGDLKFYKLIPKNSTITKGNRTERLTEAVLEGEAIFLLLEKSQEIWKKVAEIKLSRALHYDQETLRFNPFQNGLNIRPAGLLQHMRIGAYRLSQRARSLSKNRAMQLAFSNDKEKE